MNNATRTEKFLRCISSHLSSRSECRGVSYQCVISETQERRRQLDIRDILGDNSLPTVTFKPNIKVYPDAHRKKDNDKCPVVEHVLKKHFPEIFDTVDAFGDIRIHKDYLVPGVYEYELSVSGKRRRWNRVK